MKKTTAARSLYLLSILSIMGCANTETGTARRSNDAFDMGGTSYAGSLANEQNVFGIESKGLSSNPMSRPSNKLLGEKGQYTGLVMSLSPSEQTAFINEMVEFTVDISYDKKIASKPQYVIVLEYADGANGSLVVDPEYILDSKEFPSTSTRAVVTPKSGVIKFRVQTGTHYNNKNVPMYYVNVWHADLAEPASASLEVRKPAQIGVDKIHPGTKDINNDLTPPEFESDSKLDSAVLVNVDSLDQQLYALFSKRLSVQLKAKCSSGSTTTENSDEDGESQDASCLKGEPICWTFITTDKDNTGHPDSDQDTVYKNGEQFADSAESTGNSSGCGKTDANGRFWVNVNTADAYNARYFLNFFHPKTDPVTYQIDTFALPQSLGDTGSVAPIIEDGLRVDFPSTQMNDNTGKYEISGCDAATLLSQILAEEDDELISTIKNKCGRLDCSESFSCKLSQMETGAWELLTNNGEEVRYDLDQDKHNDPIQLVFVQDAKGNYYFNGFDLNGDGIVDVAVSPCLYSTCGDDYSFVCYDNDTDEYKKCSKITAPMNKMLEINARLVDDSGDAASAGQVKARIIRGPLPPNNAQFDTDEVDVNNIINTKEFSNSKKINIDFWTGMAYDAMYYIELSNDKAKSTLIPISIINSFSLPTAQGDRADPAAIEEGGEAWIAPGNMEKYIPDLGPVTIELADGANQFITAPVVKTLNLKVVVKKKNSTRTLVTDSNTWWKVTRGKSLNNNATLISTTAKTNSKGIAGNLFYTGTGYDSLYYISVFHPNYVDEKKNPIPYIFTVMTTNNTGSVEGPNPNDVTIPDGDTITADGEKCSGKDCEGKELTTIGGEKINPKYPQGAGCAATPNTCSSEAELAKCKNDTNLPECCCPGANTVSSSGKQGCLELIVDGDSYRSARVGTTIPLKVKLVWRNGTEVTPIRDDVIWTIKKGDGADGYILGASGDTTKIPTDKNGYATLMFKTGSKVTNYNISAFYPNIYADGQMIPHTIHVSVKDAINDNSKPSSINTINVQVDGSNAKTAVYDKVSYYIMSAYYNECGQDFIFANTDKRKENCQKLPHSDNANVCNLSSSNSDIFKTKTNVENSNDRFVVYAVADDGSSPTAYGCVSMNTFGSSVTTIPDSCDDDEKDDDGDCRPLTTREMTVKVPLEPIPDVIQNKYKTQTLVNIGPLMKEGTELDKALGKLTDLYEKYVSDNPGKKIYDTLLGDFDYSDKDGITESCIELMYKKDKTNCAYKDGSKITSINSCAQYTEQTADPLNEPYYIKSFYTNCNCTCATMFYYTRVNKIGRFVVPLLRKGIQSLINKYLSPEALKNQLCNVLDGAQFVTLSGEINWEKTGDVFNGSAKYTGAELPFLKEPIELSGKVIEGKWGSAKLANGSDLLAISNYTLNFTYGEFLYELLAKYIGAIDDSGKVSLNALIRCDKIIGKGFKLPLIGNISTPLIALCESGVSKLQEYTTSFAISKSIPINLTLQGSAEFTRSDICDPDAGGIGCQAQHITKGIWNGTGSLGSQRADGKSTENTISGIWIGYINDNNKPDMTYGDKSMDEFIAENSLCRKKLKESAQNAKDLNSNKECLLGTYDNPSARAANNACANESCRNKTSIVVCTSDGKFNSKFASATAGEIIKSANAACKAQCAFGSCPDDCKKNSEIINQGNGLTNAECLDSLSCNELCQKNPTIFVCNNDTPLNNEELLNACELSSLDEASKTTCFQNKVQDTCIGNCDSPECIMNSELITCKSDTGEEQKKPSVAADIIAEWTFDSYFSGGEADNDKLDKDLRSGLEANKGTHKTAFALKYICDPALPAKLVAGPNAEVDAISTRTIEGNSCFFSIVNSDNESTASYTIKKVDFNVLGGTRVVSYQSDGGTPSGSINTTKSWRETTVEYPDSNTFFNTFKIWGDAPEKANIDNYSPMRLYGIKVYGIETTND